MPFQAVLSLFCLLFSVSWLSLPSMLASFYPTERFYARVYSPEVELALLWYAVTANVIGSGIKHALAHMTVEVGVIVVDNPLAERYGRRVGECVVIGFKKRVGRIDVLPIDGFRQGVDGYYRTREQEKLVDR